MNDKKEPIRRRKFDRTGEPADFKTEALRMVAEGQSASAVARSLNVSEKLLSRWESEQKNQTGKQKVDQTDEVALLKGQLRRVEMERDILKSVDSASPIELRRQLKRPRPYF